jgi:hypothetical protein
LRPAQRQISPLLVPSAIARNSNKHFQTFSAAHCVSKLVDEFGQFEGAKHLEIVLGEWKTDREQDCDYFAEEEEICESTAYMSAEKIVQHKDFDENDIAIVRLTQEVRLNDLISNIELPETSMCENDFENDEWTVTGFG